MLSRDGMSHPDVYMHDLHLTGYLSEGEYLASSKRPLSLHYMCFLM